MSTEIRSTQIRDGEVKRQDLNTADSGSAVITKVISGANIGISSTGVDAGTGDVTIALNISQDINANGHKITNTANPTSAQDVATKSYVDANASYVPHPFLFLY
jgi:uncharacterized protein involved in outer membrane biogenesis